jgi:hypothetical protein
MVVSVSIGMLEAIAMLAERCQKGTDRCRCCDLRIEALCEWLVPWGYVCVADEASIAV